MMPYQITLFILGALGTIFGVAAVFLFVYSRYEEIEKRVLTGIAGYAEHIYDLLDRMYRRTPMNKCYLIILVPTISFAVIGFAAGLQVGFFSAIMLSAFFAWLAYKIPGKIIQGVFDRRVAKFDKQLVDALNMMSNAIKSGLSFMQVVQVIEREMPNPCSQEFGMVLKENRVGVNLNDALLNMTKRIPSDDLFMIMNSVVTLSQQGGDLSEAFETIAVTIRERQRVTDKIRTLAQAGITQGSILSALPIVMLGLMYIMQPKYVFLLFTTSLGVAMLIFMFIMIGIGALWIRNILQIEV